MRLTQSFAPGACVPDWIVVFPDATVGTSMAMLGPRCVSAIFATSGFIAGSARSLKMQASVKFE